MILRSYHLPTLTVLAPALAAVLLAPPAAAQVYPGTPDWVSLNPHYSTGGALVDIDRDGWLDLVVADGNDISPGHLNVYYNRMDGTLPTTADWQSADTAFNGHLDVADVNGDGWMDVAVAHLGTGSTFAPIARVYLNNAGTLSSLADWSSGVIGNAFGVSFGDLNGDGRPDLAVGTGWAYAPEHAYHNYVYLNTGTALEAEPSWTSSDQHHYQGVLWTDGDDDGWLDLVGIGSDVQTRIYKNHAGALETIASWQTNESTSQDGIMVTAGDVTGDGIRDLVATDNTQLSGSGRFKLYPGLSGGLFQADYDWSYFEGYGSAVALADVDADGDLDLATGAWWDHARIFMNTGTGLPASPTWSSAGTSVVEKIVFGDLDPACGIEPVVRVRFVRDGDRSLFQLPHQPIQHLVSIDRDAVPLGPGEYTYSREYGWISVGPAPVEAIEVTYTISRSLDMVITNWDSSLGNQLYYSDLVDDCDDNGIPDGCDIDAGAPDLNGDGIPDGCQCLPDIDGSGDIGFDDLLAVLSRWGPCFGCPEDIDGDSIAGFSDVLAILSAWGPCAVP